jgi:predicted ribosomally synthesized peptide with SipW-like signal peptide
MSRRRFAVFIATAFIGGVVLTAGVGHTFAAFSDFAVVQGEASAGTWGPPSASCATDGFAPEDTYSLPDRTLPDPKVLNMPGNDRHVFVTGASSAKAVTLGDGNDVVVVENGIYAISLGHGNNCVIAGNGPQQITLGNGDNIVRVGDGPTTITVGDGDNVINGGNGGANVSLGGGNNTVTFGNGPDDVIIRVDGGHNDITVGNGDASITGSGQNVCHVPHSQIGSDDLSGCDTVSPT